MTVKEIVDTVARELGVYDEVMKYVEGVTTDGEVVAEMLLDCFNIVENELALDYFPMYAEEKMLAVNEKLFYKDFSKSPVRIVKVCNQDGEEIAYGIYADHLKVPSGLLTVTYAYTPNKKKMNEPMANEKD